jgi:hypothetical protein
MKIRRSREKKRKNANESNKWEEQGGTDREINGGGVRPRYIHSSNLTSDHVRRSGRDEEEKKKMRMAAAAHNLKKKRDLKTRKSFGVKIGNYNNLSLYSLCRYRVLVNDPKA